MAEQPTMSNESCHDCLFSVKLEVSVRNFSRQSSGSRPDPIKINADTLHEWIHVLWLNVKQYLKRKVLFVENVPVWHTEMEPSEADLKDFVTFHDKRAKNIVRLSDLTTSLLQNWKSKSVLLVVHVYSTSVDTATTYKLVQDVLIKPFEKDRSQAISHAALQEIVSELKIEHKHHYISHDINFLTWASYIASQDAHLREQLIKSPPPAFLIELFRYAPTNSDHILNNVRRSVGVANSLNAENINAVNELQEMFNRLIAIRNEESLLIQTISAKMDAMKTNGSNRTFILRALHEEIQPEENGLSAEAIRQVTAQIDIDHA